LEKHHVAVQKFIVADKVADANNLSQKLSKFEIWLPEEKECLTLASKEEFT